MSTLYLEPFSGLSGDMLNALLLDLGSRPQSILKKPLRRFRSTVIIFM